MCSKGARRAENAYDVDSIVAYCVYVYTLLSRLRNSFVKTAPDQPSARRHFRLCRPAALLAALSPLRCTATPRICRNWQDSVCPSEKCTQSYAPFGPMQAATLIPCPTNAVGHAMSLNANTSYPGSRQQTKTAPFWSASMRTTSASMLRTFSFD